MPCPCHCSATLCHFRAPPVPWHGKSRPLPSPTRAMARYLSATAVPCPSHSRAMPEPRLSHSRAMVRQCPCVIVAINFFILQIRWFDFTHLNAFSVSFTISSSVVIFVSLPFFEFYFHIYTDLFSCSIDVVFTCSFWNRNIALKINIPTTFYRFYMFIKFSRH